MIHTTPTHIADYLDDDGWMEIVIIEQDGARVVIDAPAESEPYYRILVSDARDMDGTEAVINAPPRARVEGGCLFLSWLIHDMELTVAIEIVRIDDILIHRWPSASLFTRACPRRARTRTTRC